MRPELSVCAHCERFGPFRPIYGLIRYRCGPFWALDGRLTATYKRHSDAKMWGGVWLTPILKRDAGLRRIRRENVCHRIEYVCHCLTLLMY
jgi:hypothetical protein